VVGAQGKAAAPGATGELVLTTLGRTGSPVLRYRTGDLVRAPDGAACVCGRHEKTLAGGILGRVDEMVIIRGVNIFPTAVEEIVHGFGEIAEYEAQVDRAGSLVELTIRIEPSPDCKDAAALAKRLQNALHTAFNLRIGVNLAEPRSLPRYEMKGRRWKM